MLGQRRAKNFLYKLFIGLLAVSSESYLWAQPPSTSAFPAGEVPGRIAESSRSGLILRLLWFETQTPDTEGIIEKLILPAGAPYGAQEIKKIIPLGESELQKDEHDNYFLILRTPLVVSKHRPILLGFLVEATQYNNAYLTPPTNSPPEKLDNVEEFLRDETEYDLTKPLVQRIASELKGGKPTPEALMRRVWNYINNHMTYIGVQRPNTGAEVLEWGKGACGEYARATTTLLRACGIPAREVHSVYCETEGLNTADHGWSEAYLSDMGWVPVLIPRPVPTKSEYNYGPWNRYIIYRGLGVRHWRMFEATNVNKIGYFGMGRFVSMSLPECVMTSECIKSIALDDGSQASQILDSVPDMPKAVQPLLLWLLSSSPNEVVGQNAAQELWQDLKDKTSGSSEWKTYLENSPRIAEQRLGLASVASSGTNRLVNVDSNSRLGTPLGSFKKGQIITLRYVSGSWMLATDNPNAWPKQNPDNNKQIHRYYRSALCIYNRQKERTVVLLPGGTRKSPFSYTLKEDCDIWVACNDAIVGNRISNNKGIVKYHLLVQ